MTGRLAYAVAIAGLIAASAAQARAQGSGSGAGSAAAPIVLPLGVSAPEVSASASPTVVRLGGRFTVFVVATFDSDVVVNLPEPVELGGAFEVRKKVSEDRTRADGKRIREWQLDVMAWDLGDLQLPPVAVTFTAFGHAGQIQTNTVPIRVIGVLGDIVDDPSAMRGLTPPTELVARDWFWLELGGALLIGAAVVNAAVVFARRRRRRARTTVLIGGALAPPARIDTTSERALERLLAIAASGVLERDLERKTGYAEMADVIRDYVGARYRLATSELTSAELLRKLARVAPAGELGLVATWLAGCDLVKYGGLRVSTARAHAVLDDARALVVTTSQLRERAAKVAA